MNKLELIKKIWNFGSPYKKAFFISYFILLAELLFGQTLPIVLSEVINSAVYDTDIIKYFKSSLLYAVIFVGYALAGFWQLQVWQHIHNKYIYDIRIRCYQKAMNLKPYILADINTGDVLSTINNDTAELHHIIQRYAMRVLNAAIGTIVSLIIVITMKWEIALLILSVIPISIVVTKKSEIVIKKYSDEVRALEGKYSSWIMEILTGIREIKLFVAEKTVLSTFVRKNKSIMATKLHNEFNQFKASEIVNAIYFIIDIAFYIVCAYFVFKDSINVGEYVAISSYFTMITGNVKQILFGNMEFQKRKTSVERVFKLLEEEEEEEIGEVVSISCGNIKIDNLSFAYDKKVPILTDLNFEIKRGEKIGIVGISGVGKSTLANLMLRFYEPQKGNILIDGIDIINYKYSSIRKEIGIVSQENIIFNSTVKENITLGTFAKDDEIWEILNRVGLEDKIRTLSDGLNTILETPEIELSGGQKQRLCIARLMYRNPQIIILDEATSALDEQAAEGVRRALESLVLDKTTIIISHRKEALENLDKVLVLHEGKQVGYDRYDKLVKDNQYFVELFGIK